MENTNLYLDASYIFDRMLLIKTLIFDVLSKEISNTIEFILVGTANLIYEIFFG